eukprot:5492223-Prymnesium_polylepis.1
MRGSPPRSPAEWDDRALRVRRRGGGADQNAISQRSLVTSCPCCPPRRRVGRQRETAQTRVST